MCLRYSDVCLMEVSIKEVSAFIGVCVIEMSVFIDVSVFVEVSV